MSKTKPKDKKQDNTSLIQKQYQIQKRELIDYQFTVKKLEEKLASKVIQNQELSKELQQTRQLYEEKVRIMNQKIDDAQKNNQENSCKLVAYQIATARHDATIEALKDQLTKEKHDRAKQVEAIKIRMEAEKSKLTMELKQWQGFAQLREANQIEINDLRQKLQIEKADKIRQLADKERQKVQATDKLRDDMLKQIRQMHTKYVSLKKDQLDTTTRLTILQNHQLTSELQYQSKQTEKMIFKEEDLHQKVKQMSQELAIHKQVQEQLAKRAHFSKGVIKKLNDRIAQLEEQVSQINRQECSSKKILNKMNTTFNASEGSKNNIAYNTQENNKQILVELEKQLQITQKRYAEICSKQQAMKRQRDSLAKRINKYQNCTNSLAKILIQFSECFNNQLFNENSLDSTQQKNQQISQQIMKLNLEQLRALDIENWSKQQITIVVKLLLYLIKPYITQKNLSVPSIRRFLHFEDKSNIMTQNSQRKLPKLLCQQNSMRGLKDLPINVSTKIVGSNLRQWGATIKQGNSLKKKYKISQSNR